MTIRKSDFAQDDIDRAIGWLHKFSPVLIAELKNGDVYKISSFIISIDESWFLMTAKHIIDDLKSRINDIRAMRIYDGGHLSAKFHDLGIFIGVDFDDKWIYYKGDDPKYHIDYAAFPLNSLDVECLKSNNIEPFTYFSEYQDKKADLYLLFGVFGGKEKYEYTTKVYPVTPIEKPSWAESDVDRFYGQISSGDVSGASGGPILSLFKCDDGRLRIGIEALQSGQSDTHNGQIVANKMWRFVFVLKETYFKTSIT